MRRILAILICSLVVLTAYAQTTTYYSHTSDHYRVNSDTSQAAAKAVADKMEAALQLFNETLHFDLDELDMKLKVTVFAQKSGFDDYLQKILSETRQDFVYIHYSDISKSELVGFVKEDEAAFDSSLLHQAFIQLFKAFIPNPPIWLREGLATYFDNAVYDETSGRFVYKPNLLWLDSLKTMIAASSSGSGLIPVTEFLMMDRDSVQEKLQSFYPQAWGITAFLYDSTDRRYNRMLWDSLAVLGAGNSLKQNSGLVLQDVVSWVDEEQIAGDFVAFIYSLKTFNDLVAEGIDLYTSNDLSGAARNFSQAVTLEPESFIPYYYLGLINYAEKSYTEAKDYYEKSLQLGADAALAKYALGVNAFADNQFSAAVSYLTDAKQTDPSKYDDKVDSLLKRIETLQ